MTDLERELFEALLKVREAFYVSGTRKALFAAIESTNIVVAKAKEVAQ